MRESDKRVNGAAGIGKTKSRSDLASQEGFICLF